MKIYGGVLGGKMNKLLDFGRDPDHCADCPIRKPASTRTNYERILMKLSGYVWFKYKLGQKCYAPQVQPGWDSHS